ncbi:Fic/DOC family protein [Actinacidiphila bryophytorum]|uniref:Fic/DOC family protein n=1 Tax=Actinacidiphila bryophytorum TaxID=1436133 RepID=UPI002176DD52|nr:Fic family protein [Actinacidiphila bryophytorum]UWE07645.1 Fic family protein [Actinacidiphila bryophytorum]
MIDPYALPNGVLRNKLRLTDAELLATAEADITRARLAQLSARPLPGSYDLGHLQGFHAHIFGDLYTWAGELRTVDIAKQTPFCPVGNLLAYADEVFGRLRSRDWLRSLSRRDFIRGIAELYGDLNALHPFREGNGRTQRAFLAQLGADAGREVSWVGLDQEVNQEASVKSFLGDNSLLEAMLDHHVT